MKSNFSYNQNRDLLENGCQCQAPNGAPPCSFCTSLNENEANIFCNDGLRALQQYIDSRDRKNEDRIARKKIMLNKYWVGFDFDGTISHSDSDKSNPLNQSEISEITDKLCALYGSGVKVKIITARPESEWSIIREFLEDNLLPPIEITNSKDKWMRIFYDDRAITVIRNTGVTCADLANAIIEYESTQNDKDSLTRNMSWVRIVATAKALKESVENQFRPLDITV